MNKSIELLMDYQEKREALSNIRDALCYYLSDNHISHKYNEEGELKMICNDCEVICKPNGIVYFRADGNLMAFHDPAFFSMLSLMTGGCK